MSEDDYDLIVLGAGSGGVRASRIAAELGARVAVVEMAALGGTCVNAGCIPKKLLWYGAVRARALEDAAGFGLHAGPVERRWHELIDAKDREVLRLNAIYGRTLATAGARVLRGRGRLLDAHTVEVDGARLRTKHVIVATGGKPSVPDIPGAEHGLTSDDVLKLRTLPRRAVIVGGGVIGVELAGVLHAYGAEVTLVYRRTSLLGDVDHELAERLAAELSKQGIVLRPSAVPAAIVRDGDALRVELYGGEVLACDAVVLATGRTPRTRDLGLAEAGVALDAAGAVVVDEHGRTSQHDVFALGDCIGGHALTPLAIAQGHAVATTLFGGAPQSIHPELLPRAVFAHPALGSVGLSEEDARRAVPQLHVYTNSYRPLEHALSGRDQRAFVKLCVDADSGRVLGCHMLADEAPEVIQGFAVAMRRGATKADFDATLAIHPTAAEELVTLKSPRPS